jgi:hypothetical protein
MTETLDSKDIERLVALGQKFLRTLSYAPEISLQMAEVGYSEADHKEGWSLFLKLIGAPDEQDSLETQQHTTEQKRAITYLDAWDEPHFRRATAALKHHYPKQYQYIFNNLEASTGAAAVGAVNTYVQRVQTLRDGTDPDRIPHRTKDSEAIKRLEKRKLAGTQLEKELLSWVEKAQAFTLPPEPSQFQKKLEEQLQLNAHNFKLWLDDWRETARVGVQRKDYRIRLGVSKRSSSKKTNASKED